jgi:hypothetical protein
MRFVPTPWPGTHGFLHLGIESLMHLLLVPLSGKANANASPVALRHGYLPGCERLDAVTLPNAARYTG